MMCAGCVDERCDIQSLYQHTTAVYYLLVSSTLIYCVLGRGAGERWATRVVVSVEAAAVQGDPRGRAGGQEEPTVEVSVYLRPVRGV